jgi:hypothetical protein
VYPCGTLGHCIGLLSLVCTVPCACVLVLLRVLVIQMHRCNHLFTQFQAMHTRQLIKLSTLHSEPIQSRTILTQLNTIQTIQPIPSPTHSGLGKLCYHEQYCHATPRQRLGSKCRRLGLAVLSAGPARLWCCPSVRWRRRWCCRHVVLGPAGAKMECNTSLILASRHDVTAQVVKPVSNN